VTRRWILGLYRGVSEEKGRGRGEEDVRLGVGLRVGLLGALDFAADDEFAEVVFLVEVEEAADLGCALWEGRLVGEMAPGG